MEKSPSLCKYYLHGACSKGSSCKFEHNLTAKKDNNCKFYLAGSCSYGSSCRYDHVKSARKLQTVTVVGHVHRNEEKRSTLTVLKKKNENPPKNSSWVNAPEFVPGKDSHVVSGSSNQQVDSKNVPSSVISADVSYSSVASVNLDDYHTTDVQDEEQNFSFQGDINSLMCPFAAVRECPFGESCEYLHGDTCDMCGLQCLHPTNEEQRRQHELECLNYHEKEMERAFATQKSSGVTCSICLEVVLEKSNVTQRLFGLLENCEHPFCLECIRNWRSSSHQEKTVVRSCPICRIVSWYVTPSPYWLTEKEEKEIVINEYKSYLSNKPCHYFDQGKGECPFGSSCFYRHAFPDQSLDSSKPNIRYRQDAEGISNAVKTSKLSEFIEARDG